MENITKAEFIKLIAEEQKIANTEASESLNMVISAVEKVLSKGGKITIPGFGSFYTLKNKAREGRNPRTGESINIKASNQPKFKAGSKLKAACN
jgi:DNA-binding protein HU-beta